MAEPVKSVGLSAHNAERIRKGPHLILEKVLSILDARIY
jgi:hypothetical protein